MQILLHRDAYTRIEVALREQSTDVEAVLWHETDGLLLNGAPVEANAVAPRAAWISSDLFGGGRLAAFADTMAAMPSLEWVQTANAGLDNPLYARLAANGVQFSKSGAQSIPIAEYVLTYALEHAQQLDVRREAQAARHWGPQRFAELWHSTWLIIGYGHIGRNVAKRAKAFDCNTIVVRQSDQSDAFSDAVITLDKVMDAVPRADVVVLACPATDATRGLVNEGFLAAMRESALLINVARGSLVDEAALLRSLEVGRPARAVLDVFETEPLPDDNPLWSHPRVTVTAHISNAGTGTPPRGDALFLRNLARFATGQIPDDIASV